MFTPGQKVMSLSPKGREALAGGIGEVIQQLESDNRDIFDRIRVAWDQYDARPLHKERNFPWKGASNVVMPVVSTHADAITARLQKATHTANRTWVVRSPNELIRPALPSIDEYMNSESRRTYNLPSATYDWYLETVVAGRATLWANYDTRYAYRFRRGSRTPQRVTVHRGPVVEHVPGECVLWERDVPIERSQVLVRQRLMTWSELVAARTDYDFDITGCEDETGITGPSAEVHHHRRRLEGVAEVGQIEPHDVREVWIDYPMAAMLAGEELDLDRDTDVRVPIVVHYHCKARRILRIVAHPYYFWRWPALDLYFRKVAGRASSQGVAKMLEHIQLSISTTFNQSHDAVTLQNVLKFATSSPELRNKRFNPFEPIYLENMADFRELDIKATILPDVQLINVAQSFAERKTGISDPNMGREVRLGGHPSPATNTLVQLQEGSKVFQITLDRARQHLSTLGEWILSMYQQFEDPDNPGLTARLGPADAAVVREALVSPENFQFDLISMDEMNNPDAERNRAILTVQAAQNYAAFSLRMVSLMENPQVGPVTKAAASQLMEMMSKLQVQVNEALDVDDARELVLKMEELTSAAAQRFQPPQPQLGPGGGGPPGAGQVPIQQPPMAGGPGGVPLPEGPGVGANGAGGIPL